MPVNLQLYPKRASLTIPPYITKERFMEGFDNTNMLVNTFIGIANEVARIAISEAIETLKKTQYYKHQIKHLAKETFRQQEAYENLHNQNFGDRLKLWIDFLDSVEEVYRPHIFNIYMSLKQAMDRSRQSETDLKAKLECGRICAMLAVSQFDELMASAKSRWEVDYTSLFVPARYDGPLKTWTDLCSHIVVDEHPETPTSLSEDKNCKLAVEILKMKLNNSDMMNKVGAKAIYLNKEVARKYANEKDLVELEKKYQNSKN